MYLLDTDVISEARKGEKANPGVRAFLREATRNASALFVSVISIGELRRGVEVIRYRGDGPQAARLERWLDRVSSDFADAILPFDQEAAHVWGRLRAPNAENPLDKQIAATALIHDLTVVTRNVSHHQTTGARLLNPFA
jgi:toxin FitB